MHLKFSQPGASGAGLAKYLLQDRDHKGSERGDIEVLRGDPFQVAAVADATTFKHKYAHCICAWGPDQPTAAEVEAFLNDFREAAWGDLDDDRFTWSAVSHRDHEGGNFHIHIFAASVDLDSGKQLNIAPPGWQRHFDLLRDAWNLEKGWARPDDPDRTRLNARGFEHAAEAAEVRREAQALRMGLEPGKRAEKRSKEALYDYCERALVDGRAKDRKDLVRELKATGLDVVRQGKNYITVADTESGGRWRLKGEMYSSEFNLQQFLEKDRTHGNTADSALSEDRSQTADAGRRDLERAQELRRELGESTQRRSERVRKRLGAGSERAQDQDRERAESSMELDSEAAEADREHDRASREAERAELRRAIEDSTAGLDLKFRSDNNIDRSTARGSREFAKDAYLNIIKEKLLKLKDLGEQTYDRFKETCQRAGEFIRERVGAVVRDVQDGHGAARKASEQLNSASRDAEAAVARARENAGVAKECAQQVPELFEALKQRSKALEKTKPGMDLFERPEGVQGVFKEMDEKGFIKKYAKQKEKDEGKSWGPGI